ncbi:MAG: hypothetical protein KTR24_13780 [Saprospiraceae bacterium]|nr:hypothetical protein [Saprospiraceae bacterium]
MFFIRSQNLLTKLTNWEYWPIQIVQIPTVAFWIWFAIRSRAIFFFSRVNPALANGGMLGVSKHRILKAFPSDIVPTTLLIPHSMVDRCERAIDMLTHASMRFPVIAKPDVGERGFMVMKLESIEDLRTYFDAAHFDVILQEYVADPMELGVFYHRLPGQSGKISSLCIKRPLTVLGDGEATIHQLIVSTPRARLQLERLYSYLDDDLGRVPDAGEEVVLEAIGNHSRGSTFLNGNGHITSELESLFDKVFANVSGINYGRFDLRCHDLDALTARDFKIFEFNGVASEPAHVYDPDYGVLRAYRDIYAHWKVMYRISQKQKERGIRSLSLEEGLRHVRAYFSYMRDARRSCNMELGIV